MSEEITYHLKDFDGPLDLLLHLIKINEMDILDIPIVEITEQYLAFLRSEEERNLDVAGEFLVMAASLMRIKSRFLLPRPEIEDDLADVSFEEDPRDALMEQLLEYQKYQNAAGDLREREEGRMLQFGRAPMPVPPDTQIAPLPEGLVLLDLQLAFNDMLARRQKNQHRPRTMAGETWSIKQQMQTIVERVTQSGSLTFQDLFERHADRDKLVTTFLALLELVRHQHLNVKQSDRFGEIEIEPGAKEFKAEEILE